MHPLLSMQEGEKLSLSSLVAFEPPTEAGHLAWRGLALPADDLVEGRTAEDAVIWVRDKGERCADIRRVPSGVIVHALCAQPKHLLQVDENRRSAGVLRHDVRPVDAGRRDPAASGSTLTRGFGAGSEVRVVLLDLVAALVLCAAVVAVVDAKLARHWVRLE